MQSWGRHREVEKVKPAQVSVASLPEHEQDAAMDACRRASKDYPSVELPTGQLLHVFQQGGDWDVWLNCEDADFTGICLAVEGSRDAAVAEAVKVLEAAIEELQKAPVTR
jgi:hypothetical protein